MLEALKAHELWRTIPVVVITAKDLTAEDRGRLNGHVERVLEKGTCSSEVLLREIRDLVRARVPSQR